MSFSTLLPGSHPAGLDFNLITSLQQNLVLSTIPEHEVVKPDVLDGVHGTNPSLNKLFKKLTELLLFPEYRDLQPDDRGLLLLFLSHRFHRDLLPLDQSK